jgi:hypothetical protein
MAASDDLPVKKRGNGLSRGGHLPPLPVSRDDVSGQRLRDQAIRMNDPLRNWPQREDLEVPPRPEVAGSSLRFSAKGVQGGVADSCGLSSFPPSTDRRALCRRRHGENSESRPA